MFFLFYILNQVPSHFSCVGECCNAVLLWSSLCGQNCKLACRQTVVLALKNTLIPKPYICPVIYSKRNPPISDVKPLCWGYLSDGHGAEDVEEDKGAVCKILAQQVAVGQPLDVGQRHKRQLGHYSSVKAEQKWDNSVRANIHTDTSVLLFIVCCVLCLGVPAQAAAPATRPRISGRKWMDGWMDGWMLLIQFCYSVSQTKTDFCSQSHRHQHTSHLSCSLTFQWKGELTWSWTCPSKL